MKKFLVTILAFLYISTSTGAIINVHYCMGKLAGWEFGNESSKTCGKCGMEKSDKKDNGCCKDEHKYIKNEADQKTAGSVFQLIELSAATHPVSFIELTDDVLLSITEENPVSNAPPLNGTVAVYIRNCSFII
jgi:hypothetical protein